MCVCVCVSVCVCVLMGLKCRCEQNAKVDHALTHSPQLRGNDPLNNMEDCRM